jgi:ABC-type bacteriocin/lantibiotic exporter with double-glycine peptidase domain
MRPDLLQHQRNSWFCGPAALRAAMAFYDFTFPQKLIAELAGTTREGTDEIGLMAAARQLGFRLDRVTVRTPATFYRVVRETLPALFCSEHYSHWIAVVGGNSRRAEVADPARDGEPVLRQSSWHALARRVVYGLPGETRFDIYPLRSVLS